MEAVRPRGSSVAGSACRAWGWQISNGQQSASAADCIVWGRLGLPGQGRWDQGVRGLC